MNKVIQLNYRAKTVEEAEIVVGALLMQENCLDARNYGADRLQVAAHFDTLGVDIRPDALPEGWRLVDEAVVGFLKRHFAKSGAWLVAHGEIVHKL